MINEKEEENKKDNLNKNTCISFSELIDRIICHDKTIQEISDKKWNRYLVYRKDILKYKYLFELNKNNEKDKNDDKMEINDIKGNKHTILKSIIEEYNENNITYHWFYVPNIKNEYILVKKEHLLIQKMTNEEIDIMDYLGKKHKIIPGKVCRLAKKYHITNGFGSDNILYRIKDLSNNYYFITKSVIKFAKTKRELNDEAISFEITDKNNKIINVYSDTIRDLEEFNLYNEWCEIENINNEKIIVRKADLLDLKEIYDKNLIKNCEIQNINDYRYDVHKINIDEQFSKYFPEKYFFLPNGNHRSEFIPIKDINSKEIYIRTSLLEYYFNENLSDLALEEEVNDKFLNKHFYNPYETIKNILLNYDDISHSKGGFIEIATQSGTNHIIKKVTIEKILKIAEEKKIEQSEENGKPTTNVVSIKDSTGSKIITSLNKIKEINLNDNNNILFFLEDIDGQSFYFPKKNILEKIRDILIGNIDDEIIIVKDKDKIERSINYNQIKIKNSKLKRNKNA